MVVLSTLFSRVSIPPLVLLAIAVAGCASDLLAPVARIDLTTGNVASTAAGDGGVSSGDASVVAVWARVSLDGSGSSDPNGEPLAYRWRLVSGPAGSHATIDAPDETITSIVPDVAGVYTIELVVSDGALTSGPARAGFTAGPCGANTPKIGAIHVDSATPAAGDSVLLSADVSDADLDKSCGLAERLSYLWSLTEVPKGSRATLNDPTLEKPTLFTDEPGAYVVDLVVTDALGHASAPGTVTVTASGCPVPPLEVSSVSASPTTPGVFDHVTLSAVVGPRGSPGSASDGGASPDSGPAPEGCGRPHATFHWSIVSVPSGSSVALADSPLEDPSFVPDVPGDYVAELYITNDLGERSNTASVTVRVSTCGSRAPIVSGVEASPASPALGAAVLLAATVSDADTKEPCSLTESFVYSWALTRLPAGSTARLNDSTLSSPSFTVDVAGSYEATVTVVDSRGLASAPRSVTMTASACGGNTPTVSSVTATSAAPDTGTTVVLDATATDSDTAAPCNLVDPSTLSWTFLSVPAGSAAMLSGANQTSPWFLADVPGRYVVAVRATDAEGHTSPAKTLTVTASTCGSAGPVIGSVSATPPSPNTGDTVSLAAAISDADTSPPCNMKESFELTWTLVSVPPGSQASLSGVHETTPWFVADLPGAYTVEAEATDLGGHASPAKPATIQVSTCGSAAPAVSSIAVGPAAPTVGSAVTLSAAVTDADTAPPCGKRETFDYAWVLTRVPPGSAAVLSGTTTPLSGFLPDVAGTYGVSVSVTDSEGHRSTDATKTISVAAAAVCGVSAPVALLASVVAGSCAPAVSCFAIAVSPSVSSPPNPSAPNYVVRLNGHASVRLDASASFDPDNASPCRLGEALSYTWSILAAPVGSRASWSIGSGVTTQMVAPTFNPDLAGVYQLGLVVSDGTHTSPTLVVQVDF